MCYRRMTVLILVLAMLFCAGTSAARVTLTMQVRSGPEGDASRKLVELWNQTKAKDAGFEVEQVDTTRSGYYTSVNNALFSGASKPDIFLSYSNFTALYATNNLVVDLTDRFNDPAKYPYDKKDWYPVALELAKYKGRLYALPTDTNTYLLYYRKDLISKPPETWEELYEVAKQFTAKYNPKSPTKYGITFYGIRDESLAMFWFQIFKSYGGEFFDDKGNPTLNSPAGVTALSWVARVVKEGLVPPDITTYEYSQVYSALQSGQVAMGINWDAAYPGLMDPKESPLVAGKMAAALLPGVKGPDGKIRRAHNVHDLYFVINKNSAHIDEAFQFIAWATSSPEALRAYTEAGCSPPHFSIANDPEILKKFPSFALMQEAIVKYGYIEPHVPEWPELKDKLLSYLVKGWVGQLSPKDALDQACAEIARALGKK